MTQYIIDSNQILNFIFIKNSKLSTSICESLFDSFNISIDDFNIDIIDNWINTNSSILIDFYKNKLNDEKYYLINESHSVYKKIYQFLIKHIVRNNIEYCEPLFTIIDLYNNQFINKDEFFYLMKTNNSKNDFFNNIDTEFIDNNNQLLKDYLTYEISNDQTSYIYLTKKLLSMHLDLNDFELNYLFNKIENTENNDSLLFIMNFSFVYSYNSYKILRNFAQRKNIKEHFYNFIKSFAYGNNVVQKKLIEDMEYLDLNDLDEIIYIIEETNFNPLNYKGSISYNSFIDNLYKNKRKKEINTLLKDLPIIDKKDKTLFKI